MPMTGLLVTRTTSPLPLSRDKPSDRANSKSMVVPTGCTSEDNTNMPVRLMLTDWVS